MPVRTPVNGAAPVEGQVPAQTPAEAPEAQKKESARAAGEYRPSDWTIDRINRLPKDEIKKEFGIDLDKLVGSVKRYGVLEDIASGQYTREPIFVTERIGHKRPSTYYALVKIIPPVEKTVDGKVVSYDWSVETRPVNLKYKLDEKGNRQYKPNGQPELYREHRQLTKADVIERVPGDPDTRLTPEEQDQVRLLGVIEKDIRSKGSFTPQVWYANEFDRSVLVPVNVDYMKKRLDAKNGKGIYYEGKEAVEFTFGERERNEFLQGHGAFVKDAKGRDKYIRYNGITERFSPSVTLDKALAAERRAEEREQKVREQMKEKPAKAHAAAEEETRGHSLK